MWSAMGYSSVHLVIFSRTFFSRLFFGTVFYHTWPAIIRLIKKLKSCNLEERLSRLLALSGTYCSSFVDPEWGLLALRTAVRPPIRLRMHCAPNTAHCITKQSTGVNVIFSIGGMKEFRICASTTLLLYANVLLEPCTFFIAGCRTVSNNERLCY
ncbi:hypothetical protein DE146DRAFT_8809 [Phaeosphaeria sp. MPI-PUGE-AT-0046c]|nr:hypothetical protein DE146DRAFT_8809 [Phaeosphaeria sp. MPI-PUGE-AT-0046c]